MFDSITRAALETLLSQGSGWVVAVLLLIAIVMLSKKNDKLITTSAADRSASELAVKEQFEKRLSEFRLILEALNRSSDALSTMRLSVDARTESINQLVFGFANLVRDLESNRERWSDKGEAWGRQLDDLRVRLEDLQRRVHGMSGSNSVLVPMTGRGT